MTLPGQPAWFGFVDNTENDSGKSFVICEIIIKYKYT